MELTCQLQLGWIADGSSLGVDSCTQVGPGILNLNIGYGERGSPARPLGGRELGSIVSPDKGRGGFTASRTVEHGSETSRGYDDISGVLEDGRRLRTSYVCACVCLITTTN